MVEKLNYKKYINYLYEVTEVADSTSVETMKIESEKDKETVEYVGTKPLEITMSSKTEPEMVYKPDPEIDIKEFKHEPVDASDTENDQNPVIDEIDLDPTDSNKHFADKVDFFGHRPFESEQ